MPALPPVVKTLRVDLLMSVFADLLARDRLFFQYTGANPSVADLAGLATTIGNSWNTNIAPLCSSFVVLTGVQVTDLNSSSGAQALQPRSNAGTRAGSAMSPGIAACVRFKIARRYRGGHPRMYLPAGMSADVDVPGTWKSTFVSAVAGGFLSFIQADILAPPASLGTLTHVNVSYFQGFTNKTFPSGRIHPVPTLRFAAVIDPVLAYLCNPKVASQRRRNLQSP